MRVLDTTGHGEPTAVVKEVVQFVELLVSDFDLPEFRRQRHHLQNVRLRHHVLGSGRRVFSRGSRLNEKVVCPAVAKICQ